MALLFCDGFDKYGPLNANTTGVGALLTQGEYLSTGGSLTLVAPLSATGNALNLGTGGAVNKSLGASYARLIGGVRLSVTSFGVGNGIQFIDASTSQAGIIINSAGTFSVRNGTWNGGTVLGTSTTTITLNSVHYLEWDITFSNSAAYQLWLDGVSILSGTGDTTATANNSASQLNFVCSTSGSSWTIDDLYVFDTSGTTNNAVLNTSPRVETTFPTSDNSVQFSIGAAT